MQEGGIGSTILLHTPRPLRHRPVQIHVFRPRRLYEGLSENTTPEVFGMVSDTFADGRVGLLLSASYQKRENRTERILTDGVSHGAARQHDLIAADLAAQGFAAEDQFFVPQNLNISPVDEERERTNINATFQYRITDSLKLTLDGMYDKFEVFTETNALGVLRHAVDHHRRAVRREPRRDADHTNYRCCRGLHASERDRPTDIYAGGHQSRLGYRPIP